jgi:tRNA A37 methylthiotransferase MiaB
MPIIIHPLYFNFLHIPIQSASDKILNSMRRNYNSEELYSLFSNLSDNYDLTVSTDVICGFPGETESDFKETIDFIRHFKPDIINISKFAPRPNTEAKKMKQVNSIIVKERSRDLTNVYKKYIRENNKKFLGWRGKALITKFISNKEFPFFGRNFLYKPIVLKNGELNKILNVEIINTDHNNLFGKII